jgi:ornithine carrier protein
MLRNQPRGPFALIAETVRTGGIRGLWLGQTGTLVRETGGGAAWFGFYELIARAFIKEKQKTMPVGQVATKADLATWQVCLAGVAGGVSYIVSLFPADCIKSTIQVSAELYPNRPPPGFIETGVDIWRTRGIRGLYAGCGLTCLKGGPSSAVIFVLFETMQTHFAWAFERPTKGPRADALA